MKNQTLNLIYVKGDEKNNENEGGNPYEEEEKDAAVRRDEQ